jgi:hypothetical protein
MNQKNQEIKTEFTVKDFIKENAQLLSALAVFAALTEFSNHLSPLWFSYFIAILFFTCMIIILFELWKNASATKNNDALLTIFKYILFFAVVLVVIYWMSRFQLIKINITFPVIFIIFVQIFLWIIPKLKITKLVPKEKKIKRRIFLWIIVILVMAISGYLTGKIAPTLSVLLEQIQ